jgi:AraC-like DNA-binding protein
MADDPFSDILRLTGAQTVVSGGFSAGGAWSIRFPASENIKFFGVLKGRCWLRIDDGSEPVPVAAGDVLLLSMRHTFVLADDPATPPVDAIHLFANHAGAMVHIGGPVDCMQIGGKVKLDAATGGLLVDVLPPLIHVRGTAPQAAALRWLLDQMVHERAAGLPGGGVATAQLAQLMFVQVLRAHLASAGTLAAGWLRALADPRIAPALRLMHAEPGRDWRLEELARAAAMSRTTFALHFKTAAGVAPLAYLAAWRMRLAERVLREEAVPVAVLARSLGYTSESAFSNAFKRARGCAPQRYRAVARASMLAGEAEVAA